MADRNGGYHRGGEGVRYHAAAPVYDDDNDYDDPRAAPIRRHEQYDRGSPPPVVYASRGAYYDRAPEDDMVEEDRLGHPPASTSYRSEQHHLSRHHPQLYRHPSSHPHQALPRHVPHTISGPAPALPTVVRSSMYAPAPTRAPAHYDRQPSPVYSDDERLASGSRYARGPHTVYPSVAHAHHAHSHAHAPSHAHPHARAHPHAHARAHDRDAYQLEEEALAYREQQEEAAYREQQLQQQHHEWSRHHVQPSYRQEPFSPEVARQPLPPTVPSSSRGVAPPHTPMDEDDVDMTPSSKPSMSISSLLDSGAAPADASPRRYPAPAYHRQQQQQQQHARSYEDEEADYEYERRVAAHHAAQQRERDREYRQHQLHQAHHSPPQQPLSHRPPPAGSYRARYYSDSPSPPPPGPPGRQAPATIVPPGRLQREYDEERIASSRPAIKHQPYDDDDVTDDLLRSAGQEVEPVVRNGNILRPPASNMPPPPSTNGAAAAAAAAANRTKPPSSSPAAAPSGKLKLRSQPLPKPKKRFSQDGWDSDLSADENKPMWTAELDVYAAELQERAACIEQAYEVGLMDLERDVGKRLSRGYYGRYVPVIERAKAREEADRKRKEALQRSRRDHARRQRDKEIEMELLGTVDDSERETQKPSSLSSALLARINKAKKAKIAMGGDDDDLDAELLSLAEGGGAGSSDEDDGEPKRRRLDGSFFDEEGLEDSRASSPVSVLDDSNIVYATAEGGHISIDARREQQLAEAHRRIWTSIARKDVPRVYRTVMAGYTNKTMYWRRVSGVAQREAKRGMARNNKSTKDVQLRARKVMREMLVFWRRNEKEERELRKRAEKEAMDKAKKEEEMREAKRQARKLNFLITQTELYSHFVGNKIKTNEAEESEETSGSAKLIDPKPADDAPATQPDVSGAAAEVTEAEARLADLKDLDFDDEDESNMRAHARKNAEEAVAAAKAKAAAFDARAAEEREKQRQEQEGEGEEGGPRREIGKAFDSDDMNFLNPTSMGAMDVKQPKMLTCQLKEYQLKGLNWLANLYEQGINGILADEMGLGKTVQSISLMAYLAEVHDIWGPFLVIAPASTLHNWQQEITKFVPSLKALPYWGNVKDRTVLRKFWNRKQVSYHRDAPFHVLITSYQLVVSDEKYFQRVKWQYMVLDEAQAIKSSSSNRWKTLLGFDCRNRLLLTGTPVQNSMQELWALLHFIMPSLFDSHDEFSEWFSKDIESHAENKGTLNEHQLRRLHMILKPFMLRRIKKNVQNELGDKIEIDVFCDMSTRQRALYRGLRSHVSVAELMDKASNVNDEAGLKSLMNLVMQFRKVCNHPELFERADVEAPLAFARFAQSGSLAREGDFLQCPDSTQSLIQYEVPRLLVRDGGLLDVPGEGNVRKGFDTHYLGNLMNVWKTANVSEAVDKPNSAFAVLKLMGMEPADIEGAMLAKDTTQVMQNIEKIHELREADHLATDGEFAASVKKPMGLVSKPVPRASAPSLTPLDGIAEEYRHYSPLAKPKARSLVVPVVAPPIEMVASDGNFTQTQERRKRSDDVSQMLYGLAPSELESDEALWKAQLRLPGLPARGLLRESSDDQLPSSGMQVPQMNKLIIDSSKLARLDELLRELKAGGHRVLIYFQMTRMIDLMEEYLIYRQYKYLRLDGASKISDRRDMVTDWQTRPELFVFLLSTRAGGLGINLTAADTVIFYDHDWNPSNDSQAMDRAHRLGQTKQVTVYRLITKGTIDERIVKLARNKKEVQDIVVGNKAYSDAGMAKPQEIVSLLLDDDELAESLVRKKQLEESQLARDKAEVARNSHAKRRQRLAQQALASGSSTPGGARTPQIGWGLDDDEDDFFGAKPPAVEEDVSTPPVSTSKSKKPAGGTAKRPRKSKAAADGEAKPPRKSGGSKRSHAKKTADELGGIEAGDALMDED